MRHGAVSSNGTLPDGPPFVGQSKHSGDTEGNSSCPSL